MAQVDLQGGDAQRIRGQYQTSLGRDASDDEVSGWLSGSFGGGGTDAYLQQIQNSDEARKRIPQTSTTPQVVGQPNPNVSTTQPTPSKPYQNLDFWSGQGVPQTDIFNTQTGQPNAGWARTANGYERSTPQGGDLQSWVRSLLSGASSPQALAALEPQLNQRGVKLQKDSAGNVRGRLYLPDGSTADVVSQWGQPWTWNDRGAGGSGGAGGVGGNQPPGSQYSDPYTQLLESLITGRIGGLQGGYDDSARQQYQGGLQNRADSLGKGNAQLDQLLTYLQSRFTDLKGPGYTGAENEVIRTGALDPLEHDRSAARQRMTERLAAMGHTPESGVFQAALQEVDKQYDAIRGVTQNQLTMNDLNRREDRSQRAETIGASIADIPDQRAREQLDVFQALEQLGLVARNEDQSRSREAIGYAGSLNDLTTQRFQMALQAAGLGGNPAQLGGQLTDMMRLNQNDSAQQQSNQNSLWSGLGQIAAIVGRSNRSGLSGVGI